MQSLDSFIGEINEAIKTDLPGTVHSEGIVIESIQGDKKVNVNKNQEAVFFDDAYDYFFYHKLLKETPQKLKSPGKTTRYNIKADLNLIVLAKDENFKNHLYAKLSGIKWVEITGINNDPYKVLLDETGLKEFDFNKYKLFVVNYQALYKSDKCYILDCVC